MRHYKLIKLNATKSTNDKVKMLIKSKKISSGDIVWADYQYKGRGQYKNTWNSSKGKNLLITVYREFKGLSIKQSNYINFVISLSVIKTIEQYIPNDNFIKWPNDILSGQNIPNATSIKLVSNNEIEIEQVLKKLIKNIDEHINILIVKNFDQIMNLYNSKLYGRDSCRLLINNEIFQGKVINVNPSGSINVEINGLGIKEYESNRIKILL